jgi:hydroxymethylpyrimidine kinase/phosphomethylpyrimidine kinase
MDLQVFALHGVHGMAVPSALTAQTTRGVHRTLPAFPDAVREQVTLLVADLRPSIVKLGMLATDDILLSVANALERWELPRVVDPVLRASDGAYLLERRAWENLCERLIRGATLVTPNLDEAEALTGERDPLRAAGLFREMGARAVLVKGGHADGAPDDLLVDSEGITWLRGTRCSAQPHGTGCALSAAIAARLARGEPLRQAAAQAKEWLTHAIAASFDAGSGRPLLGLHACARA